MVLSMELWMQNSMVPVWICCLHSWAIWKEAGFKIENGEQPGKQTSPSVRNVGMLASTTRL